MKRSKIKEIEAKQMCDMFNWFSNEHAMPLMERASVGIFRHVADDGSIQLVYEIKVMQDTRRSYEVADEGIKECICYGRTLDEAMLELSSKLEVLK